LDIYGSPIRVVTVDSKAIVVADRKPVTLRENSETPAAIQDLVRRFSGKQGGARLKQ
jgi:septum formation inhibitor-activating ATPase MinD